MNNLPREAPPDFLESHAAIANLVHRYALNVRHGQGHACAVLFTVDASFEVRDIDMACPGTVPTTRTRVIGRDALNDYICKSTTSGIRVCPLIHNLLVEVNGIKAASNCLMSSRTWPTGHELIGEYDDTFRIENGEWYFSSRAFTIFRTTSSTGRIHTGPARDE